MLGRTKPKQLQFAGNSGVMTKDEMKKIFYIQVATVVLTLCFFIFVVSFDFTRVVDNSHSIDLLNEISQTESVKESGRLGGFLQSLSVVLNSQARYVDSFIKLIQAVVLGLLLLSVINLVLILMRDKS